MRPDRALCPGCEVTHVVLDAGLIPRRAYAGGLIGQALVAAARGSGHRRIARDLAVPAGTVRGWIRGARRSAAQLRITGIRTVVAFDQDALPARGRPDELGCALEHLGAAAMVIGRRFGLQHTSPWARVNVLTCGRLLAMAPAGEPAAPFPAPACPLTGITARSTPSVRHLAHVARHLPHDTARIARFSIGIVNAAYIGIFSVGQHWLRRLLCAARRRRGRLRPRLRRPSGRSAGRMATPP